MLSSNHATIVVCHIACGRRLWMRHKFGIHRERNERKPGSDVKLFIIEQPFAAQCRIMQQ